MRSHVARRLVYAAGVTSLVVAAAAAAPTAFAAPNRRAVPATAAAAPAGVVSPVLLITGIRFGFGGGPGGRPEPMMLPDRAGSSARQAVPVTGLRLAGRSFEIPADALPYLGHGLDPNLFDLAALRRLERDSRLPVLVTYQGHVPVLPGIRITSASAGTARGYLTPASAPKFGAALRRQFAADHDRASYGSDGLFAHGVSIALAGAAAPRPVKPQFVMHTLTVHGTDLAGKPDNGDVAFVMNADDGARFGDPIETGAVFENGVAKFSVPRGNYWAIGDFIGPNFPSPQRLVIKPQLTVLTNHAQISLDERAASSEVRVTTPRPAVQENGSLTLVRTPGLASGQSSEFELFTFPGAPLWVSPTHQKPTVGGLKSFTQFQLASRVSRPGVPYAYSLDFENAGLIPAQHYRARPSGLAVVDNRYFQDFPSIGGWLVTGGARPEFGVILLSGSVPIRLPGHLTEYVTARPDVVWSQTYFQFVDVTGGFPGTAGGQSNPFRSFRPGQHVTEDWNDYPLHPQPAVSQARFGEIFFPPLPAAARVGDELTLLPTVFSDNTTGHQGAGYLDGTGFFTNLVKTVSGHFLIEQNGKTLASGNAVGGVPQVKLSGRASVVRFTLTARRSDPHYDLSTASETTWTWRSRPDPKATVPVHWDCFANGGKVTRKCAVQPMLTLGYQVAGLRLDGATAPGRQVIRLNVGHLQLASNPAVTVATMAVSFDGGKTWHAAKVTPAGKRGQFTASFTAPAKAFVTLRVTATDKAGGSIHETITSAYKTS